MTNLFKIITESVMQALGQLTAHKLRSFLSLLGISIGIFCIIAVQSSVDSLEDNIRGSFQKLGSNVVYVGKFSWGEDPGKNYWKYMKNPEPNYNDYKNLIKKSRTAELVSHHVVIGFRTAKYKSNSVENAVLIGCTFEQDELFQFTYDAGRYFSMSEYNNGSQVCLMGSKVASELFGAINPIGKKVKILGRKLEVIGIFEKEGKDILSIMDRDETIFIPYKLAEKVVNLKDNNTWGGSVNIKASENVTMDEMKDEVTGILRNARGLKPKQLVNFSLNELSILTNLLDGFFSVLNLAGLVIGLFAILVGMFSVANIMFVSVKERTNIIGIKKALGAKKYVILIEFLIESIILCIIGGLIGLAIVRLAVIVITEAFGFEIFLSLNNIIMGLSISIAIGIISGFIPAFQAASMNPVEAIRSK